MNPQNLPAAVREVRTCMARAAAAAGRSAHSVTLLAVGKAQPAELLAAAADCGISDFGESYLQCRNLLERFLQITLAEFLHAAIGGRSEQHRGLRLAHRQECDGLRISSCARRSICDAFANRCERGGQILRTH